MSTALFSRAFNIFLFRDTNLLTHLAGEREIYIKKKKNLHKYKSKNINAHTLKTQTIPSPKGNIRR